MAGHPGFSEERPPQGGSDTEDGLEVECREGNSLLCVRLSRVLSSSGVGRCRRHSAMERQSNWEWKLRGGTMSHSHQAGRLRLHSPLSPHQWAVNHVDSALREVHHCPVSCFTWPSGTKVHIGAFSVGIFLYLYIYDNVEEYLSQ